MKKYILTFEARYTVKSDDDENYYNTKYTVGEFSEFNEAVIVGNKLIESLALDHPTTPGINGNRLGTHIIGNTKNNIIRNHLRDSDGRRIAEIFICIRTVKCISVDDLIQKCEAFNTERIF